MRRWLLLAMVATLTWATGCGGGSTTTAATTTVVTISPSATQTVFQGQSVTFTATVNSTNTSTGVVTNITSTGVTWQVDGTAGGSANTGLISTAGVYTAPTPVTIGSIHTVTAVSVSDTSSSASAAVDVEPPAEISISPATATVAAGQPQTFTATVISTVTNQAVTWEVNSQPGGNSVAGTISPMGVYTAPQVPPPGGLATVTAVLQVDTTQVATAGVTDTYSAASLSEGALQCSYVFLVRGENSFGRFVRAGSFVADGNGGVTGVEDINGGGVTAAGVTFTGTYTVTADGRGTMLFHDNYGSHFGATDSNFALAMVSAQQVQISEADVFASGSGEADLQSSCSPAATPFSGEYVFDFSGTDATEKPLSIIGEFNSDVNGGAEPGVKDINDDGTPGTPSAPFTLAYQVGNTGGRGTATMIDTSGTTNFSFYMISPKRMRFIELDSSPVVAGDALAQASGAFSTADLGGNSLVTTSGVSSSGSITTAASFSADGLGGLRTGTLVQNNAGTVATGTAFTGTYTVAANGRGAATFTSGQTYVLYLIAEQSAVFQETDSGIVSDGPLVSSFSPTPSLDSFLQSLTGSFALQWRGAGASVGEQDAAGQFIAASGNFKSGTLDSNTANGINVSLGFSPNANASLTPTTPYPLSVAPGTITIVVNPNSNSPTNLQFAVFPTSLTSAVILRVDTSDARALSGIIAKQF